MHTPPFFILGVPSLLRFGFQSQIQSGRTGFLFCKPWKNRAPLRSKPRRLFPACFFHQHKPQGWRPARGRDGNPKG